MTDEEAAKLLELFHTPQEATDEETAELNSDLHMRVQMKLMGGGWHPDRGPEPERHKKTRERAMRMAELHPELTTTDEQRAERDRLFAETIAEAAAEQQAEGLLPRSNRADQDDE